MSDERARPAGDRPGGNPAMGSTILGADGRVRLCEPWAIPSVVARIAAEDAAAGLPIAAADLDVIVNTDCVDDR